MRPSVVVAGGGPAALEALITLRERLPPDRAALTLIAPEEAWHYRPLSSVAEFATHPPHHLKLEELAADFDAEFVREGVVLVDEPNSRLLTRDGDWIGFDRLLLGVGAASHGKLEGWELWDADPDPARLRALVDRVAAGELERVGIIIPADAGWPLAGFELALILGSVARATGSRCQVLIISVDENPLAVLGKVAEQHVWDELVRAGVGLVAGRVVAPVRRETGADFMDVISRLLHPAAGGDQPHVELRVGDEVLGFDALIRMPAARGPHIGGLHVGPGGFVLVDEHGRMRGSERVWAAGDCTMLPVKHSTLAVAEADAAADSLAASLGAEVEPQPFEPVLTGVLVDDAAARWWQENANPIEGLEPATRCLWWPPGGVVGSRLAHYLSSRDHAARPYVLSHPHGIPLSVRFPTPVADAEPPAFHADQALRERAAESDAIHRQLQAAHRRGQEAEAELARLEEHLREERLEGEEVLHRLNAAGFVVHEHGGR